MNGLIRIGRLVFAVAMMCFGFLYLVYASGIGRPVPGPPWSAGSHAVAWLVGVGFIAIGICIVLRLQGQAAATLLGVVFLLRAFIVYLFSCLHIFTILSVGRVDLNWWLWAEPLWFLLGLSLWTRGAPSV
jgi:ABC-type transport system involved in multi-copper enzyme maturation permease subunit